jgi:antitoxin component of MazEF toxin-antitoxin module
MTLPKSMTNTLDIHKGDYIKVVLSEGTGHKGRNQIILEKQPI